MSRFRRQLNRRHRQARSTEVRHAAQHASKRNAREDKPAATIAVSFAAAGRFCVQLAPKGSKTFEVVGQNAYADTAGALQARACEVARANPGGKVRIIRPEPGSRAASQA